MKKLLLILAIGLLPLTLSAQSGSAKLFGTAAAPVDTVHITDADSVAASRIIWFSRPNDPKFKGSVTLRGKNILSSGANRELIPRVRLYHAIDDTSSYGPWHTITTAVDTVDNRWEIPLAQETWYTKCSGLEADFTSTGASACNIEFTGWCDYY